MEYQLYRNSQQTGPYSEDQVQQMVDSGMISPQDLCWREGLPKWIPLAEELRLAPPPPNAPKFAGFWLRAVALIIDYIALMIPLFALGFVAAVAMRTGGANPKQIEDSITALSILTLWLYHACMESSPLQATLGKLVLGIRVTDDSGQRISFGRATGRHFGKCLSAITLGVGFVMAGFTERKQALHDAMASCLVLQKTNLTRLDIDSPAASFHPHTFTDGNHHRQSMNQSEVPSPLPQTSASRKWIYWSAFYLMIILAGAVRGGGSFVEEFLPFVVFFTGVGISVGYAVWRMSGKRRPLAFYCMATYPVLCLVLLLLPILNATRSIKDSEPKAQTTKQVAHQELDIPSGPAPTTAHPPAQSIEGNQSPTSPMVIAEMAITYEKMGLAEKAAEQWRRIFEMGDQAGIYYSAAEAKLAAAPAPARAAPAGREAIQPGSVLGIVSVQKEEVEDSSVQRRFNLVIPLRARQNPSVDVREVVIQVFFYDQLEDLSVVQTAANVSSHWTTLPADWSGDEIEVLQVDYAQPKPDAAQVRAGETRKFYGYVIRAYYKGELQDMRAEPVTLLKQFPPPLTL